jgi:hypothetical protein
MIAGKTGFESSGEASSYISRQAGSEASCCYTEVHAGSCSQLNVLSYIVLHAFVLTMTLMLWYETMCVSLGETLFSSLSGLHLKI